MYGAPLMAQLSNTKRHIWPHFVSPSQKFEVWGWFILALKNILNKHWCSLTETCLICCSFKFYICALSLTNYFTINIDTSATDSCHVSHLFYVTMRPFKPNPTWPGLGEKHWLYWELNLVTPPPWRSKQEVPNGSRKLKSQRPSWRNKQLLLLLFNLFFKHVLDNFFMTFFFCNPIYWCYKLANQKPA